MCEENATQTCNLHWWYKTNTTIYSLVTADKFYLISKLKSITLFIVKGSACKFFHTNLKLCSLEWQQQAGNDNHFCLTELQHLEMSAEAKRDISDQSMIDYTWLGI